ncbi:MAG: bifunctional DNA-formamidopyrimidine glycosylase/DNA-(apurinic or apyrimidinic site) lyase [Dehalococcoidia bacterium]|nr:bifunctional DNA-formamidopyrimidine glycosylase/DNA-(apurinic or apyrimidinic site) lyase [Dehalococcoidia bacterium]
MPELPEVETIKNVLAPHIIGRIFTGARILDTRPVQIPSLEDFCSRLIGRKVLGLLRRGKYLVIELTDGENLVIHLRMTGSLLWNPSTPEHFKRLEFFLDDGSSVVYTDIRRFGTFYLVKDTGKITGKLGREPLDESFTPRCLAQILKNRQAPVKSVLLDQESIAGIGNMYADEALFHAKIHPIKIAGSLTPAEIRNLHKSIKHVLNKGIRNLGASIRNYRHPDGRQGTAHREFAVAHRLGQPCPICQTLIARIVVGQRGTYYCPKCQPPANFIKNSKNCKEKNKS